MESGAVQSHISFYGRVSHSVLSQCLVKLAAITASAAELDKLVGIGSNTNIHSGNLAIIPATAVLLDPTISGESTAILELEWGEAVGNGYSGAFLSVTFTETVSLGASALYAAFKDPSGNFLPLDYQVTHRDMPNATSASVTQNTAGQVANYMQLLPTFTAVSGSNVIGGRIFMELHGFARSNSGASGRVLASLAGNQNVAFLGLGGEGLFATAETSGTSANTLVLQLVGNPNWSTSSLDAKLVLF